MRLWALMKTAVCWTHNPGIKSNILPIKATSSCVMTDKASSTFLPKLNSGSFHEKPQTANCSLQLRVCSFTLPGFKYWQGVHCLGLPCCFSLSWSEVHHFYRTRNRNNSFIRVQKSNKLIADGYRKLLRFFNRKAVQFLLVKNLVVSHLPLEALPAVETWTENCKRGRKNRGHVVRFEVCGCH